MDFLPVALRHSVLLHSLKIKTQISFPLKSLCFPKCHWCSLILFLKKAPLLPNGINTALSQRWGAEPSDLRVSSFTVLLSSRLPSEVKISTMEIVL